jgi:hypothetical protein
MSVSLQGNGYDEVRVIAGDKLVLRVRAHDPAGIKRIMVQCFQYSLSSANRIKTAVGEAVISPDESFAVNTFEVPVHIPGNAALGKWGVQVIEFTNSKGFKTAFYRGQGKFDNVSFEVTAPPRNEDHPLEFNGVEIAETSGSREDFMQRSRRFQN